MENEILERLDRIEAALPIPRYVGIEWLAAKYGVSPSYVRNNKYLQPNYGVSDVAGRLLWHVKLAEDWVDVAPRIRKAHWDSLAPSVKERILKSFGGSNKKTVGGRRLKEKRDVLE